MRLAVLTGDIVRSTDLSAGQLDDAMLSMSKTVMGFEAWHAAPAYFSRNRGDGWQVSLEQPKFALRSALLLTASLALHPYELASRISIAIGDGELAPDLNSASGPVFVNSGRGLDDMTPPVRLAFSADGALAATARVMDYLVQDWTQAQARAMYYALPHKKPANRVIAEHLGITRQSVDQALDGAGYRALNDALMIIEDSIE